MSRFAGVSEAGARRRNPERSEGTLATERDERILVDASVQANVRGPPGSMGPRANA